LTTVVVDIGIVRVVSDSSLKVTESAGRIAKLHVDTGNLDPRLDKRGHKIQTLFQVSLGSLGIADKESTISECLSRMTWDTYLKVALKLYASACPSLELIP
jgi:hypothetical protein